MGKASPADPAADGPADPAADGPTIGEARPAKFDRGYQAWRISNALIILHASCDENEGWEAVRASPVAVKCSWLMKGTLPVNIIDWTIGPSLEDGIEDKLYTREADGSITLPSGMAWRRVLFLDKWPGKGVGDLNIRHSDIELWRGDDALLDVSKVFCAPKKGKSPWRVSIVQRMHDNGINENVPGDTNAFDGFGRTLDAAKVDSWLQNHAYQSARGKAKYKSIHEVARAINNGEITTFQEAAAQNPTHAHINENKVRRGQEIAEHTRQRTKDRRGFLELREDWDFTVGEGNNTLDNQRKTAVYIAISRWFNTVLKDGVVEKGISNLYLWGPDYTTGKSLICGLVWTLCYCYFWRMCDRGWQDNVDIDAKGEYAYKCLLIDGLQHKRDGPPFPTLECKNDRSVSVARRKEQPGYFKRGIPGVITSQSDAKEIYGEICGGALEARSVVCRIQGFNLFQLVDHIREVHHLKQYVEPDVAPSEDVCFDELENSTKSPSSPRRE